MRPPLSFFGKLHGHGDFVSGGSATPLVLEFREWVEAGVARAAGNAEFPGQFDKGTAFACVYRSKATANRCFVGVLAPSRDAVGRRFPLVVGVEVDTEPYRSFPHLPPLCFGDLLQKIYERMQEGVRGGDAKLLQARLEGLTDLTVTPVIDEARAYTEWAQRTSIADAFAWIHDPYDLDGLERTVAFIRSAAAPFRGQSEPPTPVALRFPLGAAGAGGAVLWLDVARRIAEWSQMVPTCFWSVSSRRSDLVVQLGHTPPSTFGELWAPRAGSEHLCDLTEPLTLAPVNLADPTDDQHRAGRRGAGPGGGTDGGAQHGGAQHGGAQHGGVDAPRQVALAGQTSIFEFLCSL